MPLWLKGLRDGDPNLLQAFKEHVFAVPPQNKLGTKQNLTAAYGSRDPKHVEFYKESVREGLQEFHDYFGFRSKSFIAPSYTWGKEIETTAKQEGVKAFQGIAYQTIPREREGQVNKNFHYTGQRNKAGQIYLVRNAFFEPSLTQGSREKVVQKLLRRMAILFALGMPVIIGSHRLNYIGSLRPWNRDENLRLLSLALKAMLKKWPDLEFISSSQLVDKIIENSHRA